MAFIQETESGTWCVRFRAGGKQMQKTFKDKASAKRFKKIAEAATSEAAACAIKMKVAEIFSSYRELVTARKRGARSESLRIGKLMNAPFAQLDSRSITRKDMQNYCDSRIESKHPATGKPIAPGTVLREFKTISAVFNWAVERGYMSCNPAKGVHLPKAPDHRERVASDEDIEKLLVACGWDSETPPATTTQLVIAAFLFSCRTGMRSGEIRQLEPSWIEGNVIHIPANATKTLSRRDVALGAEARKILALVRESNGDSLFSMSADIRDALFRKVRDRAGLGPVLDSRGNEIKEGLHFHDGRATFATWAASPDPKTGVPRLNVMALARQTGHKDLKMLMRYYRQTAEQIAAMLD